MNADDRPPIVFACDKAPTRGAPHFYMAAIWLNRSGFTVGCLCSGTAGDQGADGFTTPLGRVAAEFLKPLDREQNPLAKLKWHLAFTLRLLAARLRAPRGAMFFIEGSVACPAAWLALAGVPARRRIYQTQDYLEPGRHPVWAFFERRVARGSGEVFCNEPNRARYMASSYRLHRVPLTLPTALPRDWMEAPAAAGDRFSRLRRLGIEADPGQRLVLHQGPYVPRGRCGAEILEAFRLLPKNYVLVFTGNGSAHRTDMAKREIAGFPALEGRVHFVQAQPYHDLLRSTELFDLGLLLYPNDGVGNFYQAPGRLTEYISRGLPVVTSRFPGLELLVLKHGLGRVCDPDSPEDIARAVAALGGREPAEAARDRLRLRAVFEEHLCYERAAPALLQAVREALDPAGGAAPGKRR